MSSTYEGIDKSESNKSMNLTKAPTMLIYNKKCPHIRILSNIYTTVINSLIKITHREIDLGFL